MRYEELDEDSETGKAYLEVIQENAIEERGYFLKPSQLFSEIAKRRDSEENSFILEDLGNILSDIENSTMGTASEDDFDKLFEDLDLTSTKLGRSAEDRNEVVTKIMQHLSLVDFELDKPAKERIGERDVLGDAYEYLIGQFAAGAGKKAGEFYTPKEVSIILARLVTIGKSQLKSVYDPTCGSGSLLLRVQKIVGDVAQFYGQELNRTTYNLARMNMILHGVHYQQFNIKQADTLQKPQHIDQRFEAIVANPPFSAKWKSDPLKLSDDRFSAYGKLAPASKADYAFIQHMIHHLADNGQMAVVVPHGALFRGAAEGHIRRFLIENRNYLDAVIGLPANIFFGTSIPTCILVFKKCREQPDNILFIDASQHFEKDKNQNKLRKADIDRILDAYKARTFADKYSYVATLDEVAENDYNLNIPRYVDTFEPEAPIDLAAVAADLKGLDKEMESTQQTIAGFCAELGIDAPF